MKPYQKIVVAIDYSESSKVALFQALQISRESGARLMAFHAISPRELENFAVYYTVGRAPLVEEALEFLERWVEEVLGESHGVICQVREGVPHREVSDLTQETGSDLLVIGSKGHAEAPDRSGKFAIKCLRFMTIPILLARKGWDYPYSRIDAFVDFSASTESVMAATDRIVGCHDPEVHIVHATSPPWLHPPRYRILADPNGLEEQKAQYREILEGQLESVCQKFRDLLPSPPTATVLEDEYLERAILNHLSDSQTSLAILGRTGEGAKGMKNDFLGGTAEALLRFAHCSVLTVPVLD